MKKTEGPTQKIEHDHSWRSTLAVMFLAQFIAGASFSFVLPFFPFYFRALGVSSDKGVLLWTGWSAAVFGLTMFFIAPIWGQIADRYGRKLMVLRSMFAGSIVLGLMGLATQPWHLLALRILQGATTGTITASITLISSITPSKNRGMSLGLLQTAMFLGVSISPLLGGIVFERLGFRVPCGIAFVSLFIAAMIVLLGASEKFTPPLEKSQGGLKTIKNIVRTPGFKVILSLYFLIYVLSTMIIPILPLYIELLLSTPSKAASLTGLFLMVTGFLTGISATIIGRLSDRFGPIKIIVFSLFASGLLAIPQAFARVWWVLFIERCLWGFAVGGIMPSVHSLVSKIIPREKVGSAFGITTAVTCLGLGMGPLIGGSLASIIGLRWPFVIMGIYTLITAIGVSKTLKNHPTVNQTLGKQD